MSRVDVAIVMTCLGLLAGMAVPRQANIAADARRAQALALARNAGSAAGLAHALWQSQGQPGVLPGSRGRLAMVNGYPSRATLPLMLAEPETSDFIYADGVWQHQEVPRQKPCGVIYRPPATPGETPGIQALTAGC